jgi:hypothetical protein
MQKFQQIGFLMLALTDSYRTATATCNYYP